ncbi:hypothetical protein FEM48_Zijuj12G0160200 [Ziziphus jujuba var. spinosa]|uniref:Pentatricopeptide repeat-containing protein At2g46050, mitochondrial-like n=1 Tax=Ziziphus jujuba var. spinosa TaxID=714518 RepID=A0A978UEA3_ZIZJJ|nr:hypothetical protein FEM48_Zijuj12G0160200 [Ziziphus jujuba var. spinosa]
MPAYESSYFHDPHWVHSLCSNALKISAKMGFLCEGKQLHGHLVKLGLCTLSLQHRILCLYVRCKEFGDAHRLLGEMTVRNVVAWNTVICGVVDDRSHCKSNSYMGFYFFRRMLLETVHPDNITFNGLIRTCIELNDIEIGRQLHCFIVKLGFDSNCFVVTALVDLYAKSGLVEYARLAFEYVLYKDLVLWNVMVHCYASNHLAKETFGIFKSMQLEGVKVDEFTFCSLLNLCGNLGSCDLGKQIHGVVVRQSFDLDVVVASTIVDMYAKNEDIGDARRAFDMISIRNVVSWNTMIVAYGQHGEGKEAIRLFQKMLHEDFYPDELTLASIVSSCGDLSVISELTQVHAYIIKSGFQSFPSNANALIDAYSKCGCIVNASQCFSSILDPDLFTWTSLICAYAFHGLAKEATECFEKMLIYGIRPDGITFLGVLSACIHGGLIHKGLHYFKTMIDEYCIPPDSEHYTCLIDLIGRSGLLDEAFNVLTLMPTEAGPDTLGAFLGACKVHGNVGLAKWAAEKLFALEPNKPTNYILMSNTYSSEGHWTDVARIRKTMRNSCDHKAPGCSWVEITGDVHTFVSRDKSHPQASEVYAMLWLLLRSMKEEKCFANAFTDFEIILDECAL